MNLEALKAELNLTHDADDALLQRKLDAAIAYVDKYVGRYGFAVVSPPDVQDAVLRLAAHYYTVGDGVPAGVHDRLRAYRTWTF